MAGQLSSVFLNEKIFLHIFRQKCQGYYKIHSKMALHSYDFLENYA